MKNRIGLIGVALVAVVALGAASSQESVKRFLQSIMASSYGARGSELVITLGVPNESSFTYRVTVDQSDVNRMKSDPSNIHRLDHVLAAKKKLAEKWGYGSRTYGSDSYKMMGGVTLQQIEIKNLMTGQSETLYRQQARAGRASSSYID